MGLLLDSQMKCGLDIKDVYYTIVYYSFDKIAKELKLVLRAYKDRNTYLKNVGNVIPSLSKKVCIKDVDGEMYKKFCNEGTTLSDLYQYLKTEVYFENAVDVIEEPVVEEPIIEESVSENPIVEEPNEG